MSMSVFSKVAFSVAFSEVKVNTFISCLMFTLPLHAHDRK